MSNQPNCKICVHKGTDFYYGLCPQNDSEILPQEGNQCFYYKKIGETIIMHRIKLFLYYHSFRVLFKKYRAKWFDNQLQELITESLEDMPQGFFQTVLDEAEEIRKRGKLEKL